MRSLMCLFTPSRGLCKCARPVFCFEVGFFLFTIHHTPRNNPPHCLQNVDATSQGETFRFLSFRTWLVFVFVHFGSLFFVRFGPLFFVRVSPLGKTSWINVPNLTRTWPAEKMHKSLVRQCLKLMSLLLTKKATGESWYAFNRLGIRRLVTIACIHYIF